MEAQEEEEEEEEEEKKKNEKEDEQEEERCDGGWQSGGSGRAGIVVEVGAQRVFLECRQLPSLGVCWWRSVAPSIPHPRSLPSPALYSPPLPYTHTHPPRVPASPYTQPFVHAAHPSGPHHPHLGLTSAYIKATLLLCARRERQCRSGRGRRWGSSHGLFRIDSTEGAAGRQEWQRKSQ
ncbi:hypothetical protein E2C01_026714 [Portunus trituberculatus]|uniref:Uncharacterized protein n=1 Tax=Portunus trituberculatus TaxID=210409 RepID=A0A5B7EJJ0_PORTR|nr:hypothetical protein [Portunus trituberculatus]